MKTAETKKLREIFNAEILKYSDSIFNQMLRYYDSDCYVVLTEEILNFLDTIEIFDIYDFVNNYSSAIGEAVYISFYGETILPLDKFKKSLEDLNSKNYDYSSDFFFYTLEDIKMSINDSSNNKGFIGLIDSYSYVKYEDFDNIFIYSILKMKNNK